MEPTTIFLDADIVRNAKTLALTSYCYTHDDCDPQCRLYHLCMDNIKSGDMGVFDVWPMNELDKGMKIINGSVHICYRNVTDSITPKGNTRLYGRIINSRRQNKRKDDTID